MRRVLFICKRRPIQYGESYGLLNSCRFLCNALHDMGVESKTVEVIDNNQIDKEVHHYRPTHVFIEALWVVPEKFNVLIHLHPHIHWYVRLHSNIPFLANEGMAMDWIAKYFRLQEQHPQFHIAPNSHFMVKDLERTFHREVVYAPNIYQPHKRHIPPHFIPVDKDPRILEIGCFGAIRPLKNQLIQAMAAIAFADELGKILHFHINFTRIETHGDNVYRNLVALFNGTRHKLVTHEWILHHDFIQLVKSMDMGLQVSFSETFNIVAADFVHLRVPIVGSHEIVWLNSLYKANPTNSDDIISHMWLAWIGRRWGLQGVNNIGLNRWNNTARTVWSNLLYL